MSHAAWIEQAENDLSAAKILSLAKHHSQAVWLAAQAVEKAHKAILVALGLRYEERHYKQLGHASSDISKLLPSALHEPADHQIATMLFTLETRALSSRYPAIKQTTPQGQAILIAPTESFISSAQDVEDAQLLLHWCRGRIQRALRAAQAMSP